MHFRFLSDRKLTVGLHILAWAFIVIIPQYLINTWAGGRDTRFLYQFYSNTLVYGALFYLNYLVLVPRFFFRESKGRYILWVIVMIAVSCLVLYLINNYLFFDAAREREMDQIMKALSKDAALRKPPIRQMRIFNYFYSAVLICGFSLGLGVLEKLSQNEKQRKELEKEKLNSELAFLKNQISPHFFFNTLNNIYSLIGFDSGQAGEAVLKLSRLMRYLLYESEQGKTRLADEVAFLTNYIDLMKLRLSNKIDLKVSLPDVNTEFLIPPLLFVPFVENAFKHGLSYRDGSFIDIHMAFENRKIRFLCGNSIAGATQAPEVYPGIGLENVRKRLNLLFPGAHSLNIRKTADEFHVELVLELNKARQP